LDLKKKQKTILKIYELLGRKSHFGKLMGYFGFFGGNFATNLENKELVSSILILKKHMKNLRWEPTNKAWSVNTWKKLVVLVKWVSQLLMTELITFKVLSKQIWSHCRWRPYDFGRGDAHFSFGFNLTPT